MRSPLLLVLAGALLLLRLPALVQPMGADQSLYAYVGDRILEGELPYRDAWDQKPPAIHYAYAVMRAVWPSDAAVGAADLLAAAVTAWLLFELGAAAGPPGTGQVSALLFLLLSNPAFTRLGGIRTRAQCETFIALAVTAAFLLLARGRERAGGPAAAGAGLLFGVAAIFKYNAGIYLAAGLMTLGLWRTLTRQATLRIAAGFMLPLGVTVVIFAGGGALRDLYDATLTYNLQYSGETYGGVWHAVRYLATFPVERARVDALWTLGGGGCLVLLASMLAGRSLEERRLGRLMPVVWVGAACLSIAVNGSRGLPQYFVQANPALALAAGWALVVSWQWLQARAGRAWRFAAAAAVVLVTVAVWRVNQFPKLVEQTLFDASYALGATPRRDYLARYADDRKYSALASADLADVIRLRTRPEDRIYLFGFTCAAYVDAERASASRFFWSRPVIAGFMAGRPGYGVAGLLEDLRRHPPALVALQRKDWAPDVSDSAEFFMRTPSLSHWLIAGYAQEGGTDAFDVWVRRAGQP